jgi:hypothetical protein
VFGRWESKCQLPRWPPTYRLGRGCPSAVSEAGCRSANRARIGGLPITSPDGLSTAGSSPGSQVVDRPACREDADITAKYRNVLPAADPLPDWEHIPPRSYRARIDRTEITM